jgi:hypothetical protein
MFEDEYNRIPFVIHAEQVTLENVEELAQVCDGSVEMRPSRMLGTLVNLPVIKLKDQNRTKFLEATLGCWIVRLKGSYRIYKPAQFEATFVKKDVADAVQELQILPVPVQVGV